jgi:hypothetical protein
MTTSYPPTTAAEIARLLDSDPIVAGQIKEYIPVSRLIDLLGLLEDLDDHQFIRECVRRGITAKELMDAYGD